MRRRFVGIDVVHPHNKLPSVSNKQFMTIINVDYREQASGIPDLLKGSPNVEVSVESLIVGDYWASGTIIERKSCADLFHSLIDGRLHRQLDALRMSSHRPILLIEGGAPQALTQLAPGAMRGLIATVSVGYRIPIIWSKGVEDSARWIVLIAKRYQVRSATKIRPSALKPSKVRDQQIFILSSLPGIGAHRAVKLLDRFGTVRAVLSAGHDELLEVSGIGPHQAAGITAIAGGEWVQGSSGSNKDEALDAPT
jgi:Fanconi anemia group M protein